MCLFCFCVSLRGVVFFMATFHIIGTFSMSLIAAQLFIYPPNYPDVNLSPLIMSQLPLIVASYALLASFFACFIFRALDMDSVTQLKWSSISFGVYQTLVICMQLLFSVMFGDILNTEGQLVFGGTFVFNCLVTLVYLTLLFLYGRQLKRLKNIQETSTFRNSLIPSHENNWGMYTKELITPGLNLLQNHPPITRTNSVISIGTNTSSQDWNLVYENETNAALEEEENVTFENKN